MTASAALEKSAHGPPASPKPTKTSGGKELGQENSRDAKRLAAAILEVLAGARTPTEAATALGLSVPRYYQVESRALHGLLCACEPKPKGRQRRPQEEAARLRRDNERLQHEVTRQQSLVRAAQRTVGWMPPAPVSPAKGKKKKRLRRVARALSVANRLQPATTDMAPPAAAATVTQTL